MVLSLKEVNASCVQLLVGAWYAKDNQCAGNVGQDKEHLLPLLSIPVPIDAMIVYNNVLLALMILFRCVQPATI